MKLKYSKMSLAALSGLTLALTSPSLSAATRTWGGGNLLWNNTTASGWNAAAPVAADTAIINSGTVTFAANDTYGNATTTSSAAITINTGGTVASGAFFNTLWNLTLGGGTLSSNGGVNANFGTFNLAGTVTAAGGVTSAISTGSGSNNRINLGNGNTSALTNTTFNVGASGTLNVGTVLQDHWYQPAATPLTSTAGLIKSGAGVMNLNATNTYTGGTRIDNGTLTLGHATNTLANSGAVNVNGGTLALGTNTDTVGAVTLTSGSITGSGAGTLTGTGSAFDVRSGTISAKLGGTIGLNKTTGGTVTISSDNSSGGYTGATLVSAGSLIIDGNISTSITTTVNGTGTLAGIGTVGATTVQAGGTLAPGNSIGTLNFTNTLSLAGISNFEIDPLLGLGLNADRVNVTNGVTYGGTLNVLYGGSNTNFANGMVFNLFDASSFSGTFGTVNLPSLTGTGLSWQNNLLSNGTLTVIPEPSAALLGGLGMLLLLRRRRN